MLFGRSNTDLASIHNFYVSTGPGAQGTPIAYGPGSIINGTLMITNDKPLSAQSLRIVFKCEALDSSKKIKTSIFSVDTVVWGNPTVMKSELPPGSHMYLFAIRLPQVNYPPSMHASHFGHRIGYTLQGVIDLESEPYFTPPVPVLYLPLVTTNVPTLQTTQLFGKDKNIKVTAELMKPAYCPGDLCTVKMTTDNNSDSKISRVQVQLLSMAIVLNPNEPASAASIATPQRKLIHEESFYLSQTRGHPDIFQFPIPSNLVPTFTNTMGQFMDITYQVDITLHFQSNALFTSHHQQQQHVPNTISLPITIATVPPSYPIQITIHATSSSAAAAAAHHHDELPTFIPDVESPLPSPVHYPADRAYSVSPSNSFLMSTDMDISEEDADFVLNRNESQIDASGHLMVPADAMANTRRKSPSTTSDLSETDTLASVGNSRIETVS